MLWCLAHFRLTPVEYVQAYVCLAPPLLLGIFLVSNFLMTGVSSYFSSDQDREWWGRSGGWLLLVVIGWIAWTALALYPPILFQKVVQPSSVAAAKAAVAAITGALGALTALRGNKSRATPTEAGSGQNILTAVAVAFFVLLSILIGLFLFPIGKIYEDYAQSVIELGLIMGGLLAVCLIIELLRECQ